jgi:chromate transport protein ChrA
MAMLVNRIAPGSLWPGCVAGLYLLFYLVCISNRLAGHFQKGHEPVAAFIILMAVALCLARGQFARAWMAMAAACGVTVALMAQPFGAVLALYFAGWAILRRKTMWQAGLTAIAIGGTVAGMLALN